MHVQKNVYKKKIDVKQLIKKAIDQNFTLSVVTNDQGVIAESSDIDQIMNVVNALNDYVLGLFINESYYGCFKMIDANKVVCHSVSPNIICLYHQIMSEE